MKEGIEKANGGLWKAEGGEEEGGGYERWMEDNRMEGVERDREGGKG